MEKKYFDKVTQNLDQLTDREIGELLNVWGTCPAQQFLPEVEDPTWFLAQRSHTWWVWGGWQCRTWYVIGVYRSYTEAAIAAGKDGRVIGR